MYNYIDTISKATAVEFCLKCHFTSTETMNLIIVKSNFVHVYSVTQNHIVEDFSFNTYGQIAVLESINYSSSKRNDLFIMTESLKWSILSYNSLLNDVEYLETGEVPNDYGKITQINYIKYENFFLISFNEVNFYVIFHKKELRSAHEDYFTRCDNKHLFSLFKVNLKHVTNNSTDVHSDKNLYLGVLKKHSTIEPTLSIVNLEIHKYQIKNITTSNINLTECMNDVNCTLMFSPKIGGLLTFTTSGVVYSKVISNDTSNHQFHLVTVKSFPYRDVIFTNYCEVDDFRYLVSDNKGQMFFLAFKSNKEFIFQFLGKASIVKCLTYIDNNYFFLGSCNGDNQIIKILKKQRTDTSQPQLEVVQEIKSLAPIIDLIKLDKYKSLFCLSNSTNQHSLKSIKKSYTFTEIHKLSLLNKHKAYYHITLENKQVVIIDDYQGLNAYTIDKEVISQNTSFNSTLQSLNLTNNKTLLISNLNDSTHIVVLDSEIRLIKNNFSTIAKTYVFDSEAIQVKLKNGYLLVYLNDLSLQCFNINESTIDLLEIKNNNLELTDFDLFYINNKLYITYFNIETGSLELIMYNLSSHSSIENFHKIEITKVKNNNYFINNLLLTKMQSINNSLFLFTSSTGGDLTIIKITLSDKLDKISYSVLNTINLKSSYLEIAEINLFKSHQIVIYSQIVQILTLDNTQEILISELDFKGKIIKSLGGKQDSSLLIQDDSLVIANISKFETTNIKDADVQSKVYSIQYMESENLFAYTSVKKINNSNYGLFTVCDINFQNSKEIMIKDNDFVFSTLNLIKKEKMLLENSSEVQSNLNVQSFKPKGYFAIIGSVENNSFSKIIVLDILFDETKGDLKKFIDFEIVKLEELEIEGSITSLIVLQEHNVMLVGSSSSIYLIKLDISFSEGKSDFKCKIQTKFKCFTFITNLEVIYNNISNKEIYIVVNDFYKSLICYKVDLEKQIFKEKSRDYSPIWTTTAVNYSENKEQMKKYVVGTDVNNNIITFCDNFKYKTDDEKHKIEKVAFFNYGERINKFKKYTKILKDTEKLTTFTSLSNQVNYILFGSVKGSVGVIVELNRKDFEYLEILQKSILKYLNKETEYSQYRAFQDGYSSEKAKGYIDGSILSHFIKVNDEERVKIMKSIEYSWTRTLKDTVAMINMLQSIK